MKRILFCALLMLTVTFAYAQDAIDVLAPKLQKISVTVHTEGGQCSGTIVTREKQNYVLTAGHCLKDNREVKEVVEDGKRHPFVTFVPATVVQELYEDGASVGKTEVQADVIAYSSPEYGQDLALLKLRYAVSTDSASFSKQKMIPVGSDLVHVGSLLGQSGSNSVTIGTLSQVGRVENEKLYDQSSCPSFPGSSGGSISLRSNGEYVGMLTRGAGETFNLYIPMRRMLKWAATHHIEFIFDPAVKPDLAKVKLEDKEPDPESHELFHF